MLEVGTLLHFHLLKEVSFPQSYPLCWQFSTTDLRRIEVGFDVGRG